MDIDGHEAGTPDLLTARYWWRLAGVAGGAALLRVVLIGVLSWSTHFAWQDVVAGHDGVEYLVSARCFAAAAPQAIPPEVRRHDLGWPLVLGIASRLLPAPVAAVGLMLLAVIAATVLVALLARHCCGATACDSLAIAAAFALANPASLYYSCFALSEPLFVLLLLGTVWLAARRRWVASALLCGIAVLVRSTGVLMFPPLLYAFLMSTRGAGLGERLRQLGLVIAAFAVPLLAGLALAYGLWGTYGALLHGPRFSWPLAGFRDLARRGLFRAGYLVACLAVFLFATARLVVAARRQPSPLLQMVAAFCVIFVAFHLCLESLVYYGQRIYLADYFDRYMLAAWPFAAIALRRWWRPWIVAAATAAAFILALYWGTHYLHDVRAHGAPMLEYLRDVPASQAGHPPAI
jgi:hypothetical protein